MVKSGLQLGAMGVVESVRSGFSGRPSGHWRHALAGSYGALGFPFLTFVLKNSFVLHLFILHIYICIYIYICIHTHYRCGFDADMKVKR